MRCLTAARLQVTRWQAEVESLQAKFSELTGGDVVMMEADVQGSAEDFMFKVSGRAQQPGPVSVRGSGQHSWPAACVALRGPGLLTAAIPPVALT